MDIEYVILKDLAEGLIRNINLLEKTDQKITQKYIYDISEDVAEIYAFYNANIAKLNR